MCCQVDNECSSLAATEQPAACSIVLGLYREREMEIWGGGGGWGGGERTVVLKRSDLVIGGVINYVCGFLCLRSP